MTIHYTDTLLESLRQVGDPVPDSIIEALATEGQIDVVNDILRNLMRNYQPIPEELPDHIEYWLKDTAHLPAWVDRQRLKAASELFIERGTAICLILSTSALVECYAARKGVKALAYSYRIGHNPYRRIAETSQFILLLMNPNAFEADGRAIPAIQKIRLMHSAVRYLIKKSGRWDYENLGVPICQEDLLGTILTFTGVVIRDLEKLGATLSEQEIADYLYFWRVVGEMMGVIPENIPTTLAELKTVANLVADRHQGPSAEGIDLTKALLEMQMDLIPGKFFDGIMPALIRELVGNQLADWLEIPHSRWAYLVRHKRTIGRVLDVLDRKSGKFADLVDRLAVALLTRQSYRLNKFQRAGFEIPTELHQAWTKKGKLPAHHITAPGKNN